MSVTEATTTAAARLPLTFACGLYDRMLRLYTREVQPRGIDLTFLANDEPRDIFDRILFQPYCPPMKVLSAYQRSTERRARP